MSVSRIQVLFDSLKKYTLVPDFLISRLEKNLFPPTIQTKTRESEKCIVRPSPAILGAASTLPAKCKIIVDKKTIAYRQKMQPIEQSYNREGKGLRGHNSQRDLDTGGTPAAAVELALRVWYNRIKGKCGRGRIAGGVCQSRPCGME